MKIVLTVNRFEEIPVEGRLFVTAFDAISMKFTEWAALKHKKHALLVKEKHAWEWASFRTKASAQLEGIRLGKLCSSYDIDVFYINAEAEWAGVDRFKHYGDPYLNMEVFIKYFRMYAPSKTKLAYNGFSWSKNSDGRKLHDRELIKQFDYWVPMCYAGIAKHWRTKVDKYDIPRMPMIGVGRIDKEGVVWGNWKETLEMIPKYPIEGICFYFGNGAKPHFMQGHSLHPSVIDCVAQLRHMWDEDNLL